MSSPLGQISPTNRCLALCTHVVMEGERDKSDRLKRRGIILWLQKLPGSFPCLSPANASFASDSYRKRFQLGRRSDATLFRTHYLPHYQKPIRLNGRGESGELARPFDTARYVMFIQVFSKHSNNAAASLPYRPISLTNSSRLSERIS